MNHHPIESPPPAPADLWPRVAQAAGQRRPGRTLTLEVPAFSENLLLSVLGRAVHHEMRWAGVWAAGTGPTAIKTFPFHQTLSRHSAENAARLLTIYTAIHGAADYQSSNDPTPADLKAAATRSYQIALRDERRQQAERDDRARAPVPSVLPPSSSSPLVPLPQKLKPKILDAID